MNLHVVYTLLLIYHTHHLITLPRLVLSASLPFSYIKLFLHISDALLNDIEVYENKSNNQAEDSMISLFDKAGRKLRPQVLVPSTAVFTVQQDAENDSWGQAPKPPLHSLTSRDLSASSSKHSLSSADLKIAASLPALNSKSSALSNQSSYQLSPTWALRSFVGIGNTGYRYTVL